MAAPGKGLGGVVVPSQQREGEGRRLREALEGAGSLQAWTSALRPSALTREADTASASCSTQAGQAAGAPAPRLQHLHTTLAWQ